jgi:hypothetical protein
MTHVHFSSLAIGQEFLYNGTRYRKRSSRTAENLTFPNADGSLRWHYILSRTLVRTL